MEIWGPGEWEADWGNGERERERERERISPPPFSHSLSSTH